MKKNATTIALIAFLLLGLSLLLYPTVADYWNSFHQSRAVATYMEEVASLDEESYKKIWDSADEYNKELSQRGNVWVPNEAQHARYLQELNVTDTGIMGYVDIPSISCKLPIYHGTDDTVLQVAIGHIEGSSLPVGGESTHCVISGHRGLPSATLFTDLDQLSEGDIFMLQVMDETLTYQVEKINIVLPEEVDSLNIVKGRDLCTLVTCTPYGINSHRLLVHGTRIENLQTADVFVASDAYQIDPYIVTPIVAAPILLTLLVILLVRHRRKR